MISNRCYWPLALLLLISLVGCSDLPFGLGNGLAGSSTPAATAIPSVTQSSIAEGTVTPEATEQDGGVTQSVGEQIVRIWIPPQFDPNGTSMASGLLRARLDQFESESPTARLDVRVKALDGPGGMLDSLVAASAAAPSALPDLLLLPRALLESAAVKGLLYPYNGSTTIMEDVEWFEYAHQLAQLKESTYGIPFAGDAMVLAHSLTAGGLTPLSLGDTLGQGKVLPFPAGDPQALFTLCIYISEGGKLQDNQGRPALDETQLVNILNYYQQANLAGVMPYTLTQYTDDDQVWEAFLSGQYPMAVTWASTYLRDSRTDQANLALAPLPTPDGVPFSLARGWSWALAGQDPARRRLSVRVAEFLVEKEFLAEWTLAAGYLPPRVDALQAWPTNPSRQLLEQISYSAWLVPSADLMAIISPVLEEAGIAVLEGRRDALSAASAALEQINRP